MPWQPAVLPPVSGNAPSTCPVGSLGGNWVLVNCITYVPVSGISGGTTAAIDCQTSPGPANLIVTNIGAFGGVPITNANVSDSSSNSYTVRDGVSSSGMQTVTLDKISPTVSTTMTF